MTDNSRIAFERPYALVTFIPCYRDGAGRLWLERLWRHDLMASLSYIKDLRLCAPCVPKGEQPDLAPFDAVSEGRLRFVALPRQGSFLAALLMLPRTAMALWKAVGEAEVVHSSVVGWPYCLGWIANPMAIARGKRLLIVVESSWRRGVAGERGRDLKTRLFNAVSEALARWSCRHADVALFTHAAYKEVLHAGGRGTGYVTPAVWVNSNDILSEAAAEDLWSIKLNEPVRLLFAGRLTADKGVNLLLSALRILDERGVRAHVDIIGAGECRSNCLNAARSLRTMRLSLLDPLPYDERFFRLIERYHALIAPSLTDEQPRIVFDANARAVPLIASDTPGLRPHVKHERTGWLIPAGDPEALGAAIEQANNGALKLRVMGMTALAATRRYTHDAMHRTRSQILKRHFA